MEKKPDIFSLFIDSNRRLNKKDNSPKKVLLFNEAQVKKRLRGCVLWQEKIKEENWFS